MLVMVVLKLVMFWGVIWCVISMVMVCDGVVGVFMGVGGLGWCLDELYVNCV